MANLTQEQLLAVSQWAEDGATLNDVQQRLKEQFGISITYLDARLLLLDQGVKIKDKPRPAEPAATAPAPPLPVEDAVPGEAGGGNVTVRVDAEPVPGAVVSGQATFSDGKTASWFVDEMGRLGMKAPDPGYQPPADDIPLFHSELDRVLMQQGF